MVGKDAVEHPDFRAVDVSFNDGADNPQKSLQSLYAKQVGLRDAATVYGQMCADVDKAKGRCNRLDKTSGILFCTKKLKFRPQSKAQLPTMNLSIFFVKDKNVIAGACLSYELEPGKRMPRPQRQQEQQQQPKKQNRGACLYMTATHSDKCPYPYMVAFNSKNPERRCMIGKKAYCQLKQVCPQHEIVYTCSFENV